MQFTHKNGPIYGPARLYTYIGYSVIPLLSDSKKPAIAWTANQYRRATEAELDQWFNQQGHTGVGIVTGRLSQLAVLDLDDPRLMLDVFSELRDLWDTRVVRTKRGEHLYFHIPPHVRVTGCHVPGIDWQFEGRYVVAPPTVIDGHEYIAENGGMPISLTQTDVNRIEALLRRMRPSPPKPPEKREKPPLSAFTGVSEQLSITPTELIARYQGRCEKVGRNNALFEASCHARDCGWTESEVVATLAEIHVYQTAVGKPAETPRQRTREAAATIGSAFSRPARRLQPTATEATSRLPGNLREALLADKQTATLRVIEGLYLVGVRPGQVLTRQEIEAHLAGQVGGHSVRKALGAALASGAPAFHLAPPMHAAEKTGQMASQDASRDTRKKPTETPNGRPPKRYLMPAPRTLCRGMGVTYSAGDAVTAADVSSAKGYRQALHKKLIERRPGQYSRALLARRLGVSARTARTYDRDLGVQRLPMFTELPLFWSNLNELVPVSLEHVSPGSFLQDVTGKRYPLKYEIALRLLATKRGPRVMHQEPNAYFFPDRPPVLPPDYVLREEQAITASDPPLEAALKPEPFRGSPRQQGIRTVELWRRRQRQGPKTSQSPEQATLKSPRPTREQVKALAELICETINARVEDAKRRISKRSARKLVWTYGTQLVKQGLHVIRSRENITNPAGFLVVFLRSEKRGQERGW